MSEPARVITLLTDFGTADGYVAAVRGVITATAPAARIDDAAHDIPAGDVNAAAWALSRYWRLYPPGTIHVVVVDPGVGTGRRALAVECDDRFFVAPDNGVLSAALAAHRSRCVSITEPRYLRSAAAPTFHGRDVFAPAAAHLALGVPITELGTVVTDPIILDFLLPVRTAALVHGVVVHVDRFGNLITNIPEDWAQGALRVTVAGVDVGRVRTTYGDANSGSPLALIGSDGLLEIAVRDGSAQETLAVQRGAEVQVFLEELERNR